MAAKRGFTLIELLTTVSILAILLALTIPATQFALASAYRARCQGNLRQIGAALYAYAAENNNCIPSVYVTSTAPSWAYSIWTYAGYSAESYQAYKIGLLRNPSESNIFRCPGTRAKAVATPKVKDVNPNKYSYGLNCGPLYVSGGDNSKLLTTPIPLSRVARPTATVMVTECSYSQGDWMGYRSYFGMIPHSGGSNVLYYDGHIDYFTYAQMPASDQDPFWTGK